MLHCAVSDKKWEHYKDWMYKVQKVNEKMGIKSVHRTFDNINVLLDSPMSFCEKYLGVYDSIIAGNEIDEDADFGATLETAVHALHIACDAMHKLAEMEYKYLTDVDFVTVEKGDQSC